MLEKYHTHWHPDADAGPTVFFAAQLRGDTKGETTRGHAKSVSQQQFHAFC